MNPTNPNQTILNDHNFDPYDVSFNDRERYLQSYMAYEQYVSLFEEAEGSRSGEKKTRAYIPREREEA